MLDLEQITLSPAVLAVLAALAVGFTALWANPKRGVNQVFFTGSLHVAAWLLCLEMAMHKEEGIYWLRMVSAVGALLPAHLWILKESVQRGRRCWSLRYWWPAGLLGVVLALLCFTSWFIPAHSTPELRLRGWGYYTYMSGVLVLYVALLIQVVSQCKATAGVQYLELQVLLLGGCSACFAIIALMVANTITHEPAYILLQPVVVLVFYAGTTWAIITTRVFDARHILFVCLRQLGQVGAVALCVWGVWLLTRLLLPEWGAFLLAIALGLGFSGMVRPWFQRIFDLKSQAEDARREAYAVSRRELQPEALKLEFERLLRRWSNADQAHILTVSNELLRSKVLVLRPDGPELRALAQLHWATPERLARKRINADEEKLQRYQRRHALGVMIAAGDSATHLVVAVGIPVTRRPFTYPQVAQLMELATIMENALERAEFSLKAQQAEQLATVGLLGASLAHEIRNPLVTIKAFVQLLPQHYGEPAFREKFFRLIGMEVERIDGLTEQLLDLATPRTYNARLTGLHALLQSSIELIATKADDKNIRIQTDFHAEPDTVFTDAMAAKQVLLNLGFNAIQAVEGRDGERWIRFSTRNVPDAVELVLEDNGPGLAPEILSKLFQPFQSTKSTGFGLGLAICRDILNSLKASIAAGPAEPGRGAVFRLQFPCRAS